MKFPTFLKLITVASALSISAFAFSANNLNLGENDLAIKGYDPVAYFTVNKAIEGSSKFTATYQNAIYQFSSAKNRDSFKVNPEKFAPQYGGFCAFGVSVNKKFDTDPKAFKIVDNKLYLNLNKNVQNKWLSDIPGYLEASELAWNGIESTSVKELNAD
jgi:YHS domain-containing protein